MAIFAVKFLLVRRGLRLWAMTDHYGATIGAYEEFTAQLSSVAKKTILDRFEPLEKSLEGFSQSAACTRVTIHGGPLARVGVTMVTACFLDVVEAMARSGALGSKPSGGGSYLRWRSLNSYSPVWLDINSEPVGVVLPMIQSAGNA